MKFKGEPNLLIRITKPLKGEIKHFTFDENGHFETNHPMTIKRLEAIYEVVGEEDNAIETGEEIKLKKCKKCDFECKTQGELLQHYKKEHKKEE